MGIGFALSVTQRGNGYRGQKIPRLKHIKIKKKHKQQHVTKFIGNKTL
jgi:hypothetical protein